MYRSNRIMTKALFIILTVSLFIQISGISAEAPDGKDEKIRVFVSILPQTYFVERIGGEQVETHVMVGPGQSPATYEPAPKQMAALSDADLYFRIGVPFEDPWMDRIRSVNPDMKIVDTRQGIELLPMSNGHHHGHGHASHDHGGLKNPHIWLSPRLVKIQASTIHDSLVSLDPVNEAFYCSRLQAFQRDLDRLDGEISRLMKDLKNRKFMVFHPAWGYFAADYGLEEIPIEIEGKEPNAKDLARLIQKAGDMKIKIVFVQEQFSRRDAKAVAKAIGGRVVAVDPLGGDYLVNMRSIAETFAEAMR